MSSNKKPGQNLDSDKVVDINSASDSANSHRHARREAKAAELQNRFSAARRGAEPKTKAAERLKKLFKQPRPKPSGKR